MKPLTLALDSSAMMISKYRSLVIKVGEKRSVAPSYNIMVTANLHGVYMNSCIDTVQKPFSYSIGQSKVIGDCQATYIHVCMCYENTTVWSKIVGLQVCGQ